MRNKLIPRTYKCKCGAELKEYVWDSELQEKKLECPDCSGVLTFNNIKVEKVGSVIAIRTPTKNR